MSSAIVTNPGSSTAGTNPFQPTPTTPATTSTGPTAKSAHAMLKAILIEVAFVVVATMIAGVNDSWATGMVTLMLALLVLRGLFEVDIFTAFANATTLHP